MPPQDVEAALMQREENEILRQKINEIGAAIIRAASGSSEAAPEDELAGEGAPSHYKYAESNGVTLIGRPAREARIARRLIRRTSP